MAELATKMFQVNRGQRPEKSGSLGRTSGSISARKMHEMQKDAAMQELYEQLRVKYSLTPNYDDFVRLMIRLTAS